MNQPFRTTTGGRIRRDHILAFSFDGRRHYGYEGDTLASALLANGIHLVGRSVKFHRPRGIFSAGAEEPNALVTIDRGPGRVTPNLRATQVALYDGLCARSQNCWPSLRFDFGSAAGAAAPLLTAGFYYKTFMWPRPLWRWLYEPLIRRIAGLGYAPRESDADRYAHHYAHCEVLVIGGGPAGLAAAQAAAETGVRVILCDEQEELGGSLLARMDEELEGKPATTWLEETLATLISRDNVTLLPRTTAFGWFADNFVGLAERLTDHLAEPDQRLPRERLWQVRAGSVVIAAGAIERPMVFPANDRPGIMLADAARTYLHRYGAIVGRRIAVVTAHDSAYRAALALHGAGADIVGIADRRPAPDGSLYAAAEAADIPVFLGAAPCGSGGRLRVRDVRLAGCDTVLRCDAMIMCGGWTPSVHLFSQARGQLRFDFGIGASVPGESIANIHSAGACAGTFDLRACLDEGYAAGMAAARLRPITRSIPTGDPPAGLYLQPSLTYRTRAKEFVDFQNDVTTKDLHVAMQEGFRSIEHVKRYTTAGMATDQGKTSNVNTISAVAELLRLNSGALGHTTFRLPYTPVTFGTLAGAGGGKLLFPERRTPLHDWAAAQGAPFEDAGLWKLARCFPRPYEDERTAVARECRAVRTAVGMMDVSTLGKIEIVGPDAAEFLDRMYMVDISSLLPGRCRYGPLLHENGTVLDCGIVARIAPDRFHVTTTTVRAEAILHHLEDYRQTEFAELRVWLTPTTEQWSVVAVQGPRARDVISPLIEGVDVATMPDMSVRECRVAEVPAQLFRVSFTGEVGFEINVPSGFARYIWDSLLSIGEAFGITPYGTDAMRVLRAEKGHIMIGHETDGTVTPSDLGMDPREKQRDFIGKRSLVLDDLRRDGRRQLVGLLTVDRKIVLEEGAQIVAGAEPGIALGYVSSAYWSDTLQRSIALALVTGGCERIGTTLQVPTTARMIPIQVVPPCFYDRKGERLHV